VCEKDQGGSVVFLRGIGVGKISRRRLYWLSIAVAFFLFLYYLIPEPKDNPYMKVYSSQDGGGFAGCEFTDGKKSGAVFRFHMSPEECRLVDYSGGDVLTVSIDYPSMKVVKPRIDKSVITIRMFPILRSSFWEAAFLEGVEPSKTVEGVKFYDYGGLTTRTFDGGEGETVFATDHERYWLAKRLFKDLRVSYQYARTYEDVRLMDKFVVSFLKQAIVS
jgi:hypothetical protein